MNIRHVHGTTFHVTPSKGGEPYTVDVAENNGNGICTCVDFRTRRQPAYDRTKQIVEYGVPSSSRCKHLHAVVMLLGNMAISRMCGK